MLGFAFEEVVEKSKKNYEELQKLAKEAVEKWCYDFYVIISAWSIESRNLSILPIGLPAPNGEDNQQ